MIHGAGEARRKNREDFLRVCMPFFADEDF